MKHCPNPDCPHAESTGRLPEYGDDVTECGDCRTPLVEGPAPELVHDSVPLEAVAEFSSPHEAQLARAALVSHGIQAVVDHDHGQYFSAAGWVHVHVARTDAELARKVLEEGPLIATEQIDETGEAGETADAAATLDDDMRPMRLSRRILLARWYLYGQALGVLLSVPFTLGTPLLSLALLILAIGSLALALWSHANPRSAFGVGIVLTTVLLVPTVALVGPVGIGGFAALLALYFAWLAAGDSPPELLQARPEPTRSAERQIGEAWKDAGPCEPIPAAGPNWRLLGAIVLGVVLLLVAGSVLKGSLSIRKAVQGSTGFELVADPAAAIEQELELGLARLAHELHRNEIEYAALGVVELSGNSGIQLGGTSPEQRGAVSALLGRVFSGWRVNSGPHEAWFLTLEAEAREALVDEALARTLADIRRDWDVTALETERTPGGLITIQADIPGERDRDEIRAILDQPTRLLMKRVRYPDYVNNPSRWMPPDSPDETVAIFGERLPPFTEVVPESITPDLTVYWPVERIPVVVGRDLIAAAPTTDLFGDPAIEFSLNAEGGQRLEAATMLMTGRKMALIWEDESGARVIAAPVIQSAIGSQGIIQGSFSPTEARALAVRMLAGSRAIPLRVVESADPSRP